MAARLKTYRVVVGFLDEDGEPVGATSEIEVRARDEYAARLTAQGLAVSDSWHADGTRAYSCDEVRGQQKRGRLAR